MELFEIKAEVPAMAADAVDTTLLELGIDGWSLLEDAIAKRAWIVGIFATEAEAVALRERGLSMIARSEIAALLLAGGQGTRLGIKIPKGCYDIGLPSGKSLFQYHAERIRKVKQLAAAHAGKREADVRLPFLIMTSEATDSDTRAFFRQHAFFGLPEDQVHFFAQGALPCLTPEGKLILDAPGLLAMAPNGNGGCYVSLRDSGLLEQVYIAC